LHRQLNLVDLQFVDEAMHVGFGPGLPGLRLLLPQAFFGTAAQSGGIEAEVWVLLHDY
jgi:hypothetical protein